MNLERGKFNNLGVMLKNWIKSNSGGDYAGTKTQSRFALCEE